VWQNESLMFCDVVRLIQCIAHFLSPYTYIIHYLPRLRDSEHTTHRIEIMGNRMYIYIFTKFSDCTTAFLLLLRQLNLKIVRPKTIISRTQIQQFLSFRTNMTFCVHSQQTGAHFPLSFENNVIFISNKFTVLYVSMGTILITEAIA
jgi:hypothetical protein